jgi:hypothetical protein
VDHSLFRNTEAYKTKHVHNHDDTTTEWLADAFKHLDRLGISLLVHVLNPVPLHLFMSCERRCVLVSSPDSTPPTNITCVEIANHRGPGSRASWSIFRCLLSLIKLPSLYQCTLPSSLHLHTAICTPLTWQLTQPLDIQSLQYLMHSCLNSELVGVISRAIS